MRVTLVLHLCRMRVQMQKTRVASDHACTRVLSLTHACKIKCNIHIHMHSSYLLQNDPPYDQWCLTTQVENSTEWHVYVLIAIILQLAR